MSFADELRNTRPGSTEEQERQNRIRCVTNKIIRCVRNMCRNYANKGKHHLVGFPAIYMSDGYEEDDWKEMNDFYRMFIGTSAERRAAMARCAHKSDCLPLYPTYLDSTLHRPSETLSLNDYSSGSAVRDNVARELGKDGFSTCSVTLLEGHNVKERSREGFFGGKKHFSYEEAPGTFYVIHVDVSW